MLAEIADHRWPPNLCWTLCKKRAGSSWRVGLAEPHRQVIGVICWDLMFDCFPWEKEGNQSIQPWKIFWAPSFSSSSAVTPGYLFCAFLSACSGNLLIAILLFIVWFLILFTVLFANPFTAMYFSLAFPTLFLDLIPHLWSFNLMYANAFT